MLVARGTSARYASTGHLIYAAGNNALHAVPFDLDRRMITGDAVPILEDVVTKPSGASVFDVAEDGTLLYLAGTGGGASDEYQFLWVDQRGGVEELPVAPGAYTAQRVSQTTDDARRTRRGAKGVPGFDHVGALRCDRLSRAEGRR